MAPAKGLRFISVDHEIDPQPGSTPRPKNSHVWPLPRVVRCGEQPWAGLHNAVGVEDYELMLRLRVAATLRRRNYCQEGFFLSWERKVSVRRWVSEDSVKWLQNWLHLFIIMNGLEPHEFFPITYTVKSSGFPANKTKGHNGPGRISHQTNAS